MPEQVEKPRKNNAKILLERKLIERARAGDQDAFDTLYKTNVGGVLAVIRTMIRDQELAEDCAQDTFISAFDKKNLYRFDGRSKFSTWIHRIAVNAVLQRLRKRRMIEIPIHQIPADATAVDDGLIVIRRGGSGSGRGTGDQGEEVDIGVRHDAHTETIPDQLCVKDLVEELKKSSPGYYRMIALHDLLGFEYHEVAEIVGCSVGNAKAQRHFALKKLRKLAKAMELLPC